MYKHILVPTDGSDLANSAVGHGIELAKQIGAKLTVITVRPMLEDFIVEGVAITVSEADREAFKAQMESKLDAARAMAAEAGIAIDAHQAEGREPWKAIVDSSEAEGADLIIMASHGRTGLSALLLGSETQKVLTHTKIPVLVYR